MSITGSLIPEVFTWLYGRLTGDATLMAELPGGVHEHPAPEGTAGRYLTYQVQSPEDVDVVAAERVWEQVLLLIRIWAETSSTKSLAPAANRLDALLHRADGTTADARIVSCTREGAYQAPDVNQGRQTRSLGGFYLVLAQPLVA